MMASIKLPYVDAQRARDGRIHYWYFRRGGRRWRLPGEPLSEEFVAEYRQLLAATDSCHGTTNTPTDRRDHTRGSFGRLVSDFLESGQFKTKKPRTRAEYRRVCEGLAARHGDKPVRLIEKRHVRKMRDEKADTPGAANTVLRMLKILLNFAVEDGLIAGSPGGEDERVQGRRVARVA